ncbi:MAG: type III pantothenate kinase [Acidobacteria bacterium]|jgi:type III pantothenate kinase|nr:type III pantothenate kinase [Acidobacteriota bacterium]
MLLTVDLGNTNTVLGVFEGSELRVHWRLTTRREQTADEYGVLVRNLFASSTLEPAQITGVALASVVPPLTPVLVELSRQYLGHEPLVVEPGVKTGMPILYEPPADVGADRILNGVAAFATFGGPVVVLDFGTATTFDVITKRGEYAGGVICPGIGVSADALFQRAARLPRVDIRDPGAVIGRSTVTSMQSGLYYGYAAMCEGVIGRIRDELGEPVSVVATGGLAETLAVEIPSIEAVDPVLTLSGLRLIWERNRQAPR